MSTAEIDWRGDERDLDQALDEFLEYWSEQNIVIDEVEPNGDGTFWITVSSDNVEKQHAALIEGTNNAEGLIDFLDDWGQVNNWVYV